MSRIMRQLYAEAQAAREAAATARRHRAGETSSPADATAGPTARIRWWNLPVASPEAAARATLAWWTARMQMRHGGVEA